MWTGARFVPAGASVVWWIAGCAPNLSSAIVVEQVNVDPVPNWRAESPVVDDACVAPAPCARVGCTVRNLDPAPLAADVRFVIDLRPDPLDEVRAVALAGGEKRQIYVEFADVPLERGQTFGRCEIQVVGTTVTCWVKNPTSSEVRFELTARLGDGGDPPPEQRGSFRLQAGESRPIPFTFGERGRVATCLTR